ncbi:MAG: type VI secretion system tip protein VgrG [Gammaproteobacteria bacterium]
MSLVTVTVLSNNQVVGASYELLSVQVNHEVNRIPYAELIYVDGEAADRKFALSDTDIFEPGKKIEIKLRYEDDSTSEKTVFTGLVVRHEVNVESTDSTLTVLIKDAAVAMTQGKNHRIFTQMSDTDILNKIIGLHDLSAGTIADTEVKHAEIMQYACSDWDFMLARAESNGLLLTALDGEISAQLITSPDNPKTTLNYGIDDIHSFDIVANGEGQYEKISGTAWDAKNQQNIAVNQDDNLQLTPGNLSSSELANSLGGTDYALATSAQLSSEELSAWARGKLARTQLALIRGCITVEGRTDITLLDCIEIIGIGLRFNGKVLVTGIGHRVIPGSWLTDIQFGLADQWLLHSKEAAGQPASGLLPGISGLQIGLVSDFQEDPDKELKVKITLPTLNKDENTLWARLAAPDAGQGRGFYFRPEVGDEVVLGFINDDPRQAIILGALFGSKNASPARFGAPDANNTGKGIASKKGMVIGFDDDKVIVYLETPGKNTITLDDDAKKIELKDQHGNSIIMDENGITLTSAKDLKLEAGGNIEIKGAEVDIN